MAEVTRPAGEPADDDGRTPDAAPASAEERAAAPDAAETTVLPVEQQDARPAPDAAETTVLPVEPAEDRAAPQPTAVLPAADEQRPYRGIEQPTEVVPAPAAPSPTPPPAEPEPLDPADDLLPLPPRKRGNRLAGLAWVLLAAGLFQVLFFGVNALVALVFGGPAAVLPQVQSVTPTSLAWLPVTLFFLLYLLTVLLLNRAGRVAYVFASLVIAIVVYIATVLLFSLIVRSSLGDVNTLAQTFLNWEFILVGLVARETMLWTGLAIGSRGIRLRRRNREDRARYDQELADARA